MNTTRLQMFPEPEVEQGDAFVPSEDGLRVAHYRRAAAAIGGWTLLAQYERVGDILISVSTL